MKLVATKLASASVATTPIMLAEAGLLSLPWGEAGVALLIAGSGGMIAFVLSLNQDGEERRPAPWYTHFIFAAGAGFATFTWLAGSELAPWKQAGILFASGVAGRVVLLGIQVAFSAWVKQVRGGK